ncbi:MAG: hypothetical protein GY719_37410 [bacterium]|nr:hypothetical protein [bacterium]
MRTGTRNRWMLRFALAIVAAVLLTGCLPPKIGKGTDCWETDPAKTAQRLEIPGNFFGPTSDPVDKIVAFKGNPLTPAFVAATCGCPNAVDHTMVWVDRHGDETDSDSGHAVEQRPASSTKIDTCIEREVKTVWDGVNASIIVDIKLLGLSLESVEPLEVTYHETTDPDPTMTRYFNVKVTHTPGQTGGEMIFTPEDLRYRLAEGKMAIKELPVKYDVLFEEVAPGTLSFTYPNRTLTLATLDPTKKGSFSKTR